MSALNEDAACKIALVVSDGKRGPTATQMISFGQPFDAAPRTAPFRISFERHYADVADVRKAFAAQRPDLLVLSRYTSEHGREWIDLARHAGIPVVFHIDDDLLAVPASLGESKFKAYNSPERLKALRDNIEGSDLLYVSTAELAKRFHEHGINTPIVAGEVYCAVSDNQIGSLIAGAGGPVIGYMGTSGHSGDLAMIMPAICEVMDSIPTLQFEVCGTIQMPAELERFGSRIRHLPPVADYSEFLPFLRSLGWWVGLAPLADNIFNRCKADTKWVEYTLAGMAVVSSDLPLYHRACADGAGILAADPSEWRDAVHELVNNPQKRTRMVDVAQNKLRETYSHDRLREQVFAVFEQASRILAGKASAGATGD